MNIYHTPLCIVQICLHGPISMQTMKLPEILMNDFPGPVATIPKIIKFGKNGARFWINDFLENK